MQKISKVQRERAWKMYKAGERVCDIARFIKAPYFPVWYATKGREKGFSNNKEYVEYLAKKEGFDSPNEYRRYLEEQRSQSDEVKALSNLIGSRLEELGKSQVWLGRKIGVTHQAVSLYFCGKMVPRKRVLKLLFSSLGVKRRPKSLDELAEQ